MAPVSLLDQEPLRDPGRFTTSNHEDMHGGEAETSIMLHRYPELVRPGFENADHLADDRRHLLTEGIRSYAPHGIIGRPSLATAEKGQRLLLAFSRLFKEHLTVLRDE